MQFFFVVSLIVLNFIPSVITSSNPPPQPYPNQPDTTLRPINVVAYEKSMGVQRRDLTGLSGMIPQNHTHLVYGRPEDNGQILLANMTLYAQDGLPIVLLERFEELNVSVNCRDKEGTLALTFGSAEAFNYAKEQWSYINKAKDGRFLLIANHDGCGPHDQRQSYIVSNITGDAASLTTSLAAEAAPWSDVAASYDATIGQAGPITHAARLKRSLWDKLKGNLDQNLKSVSFNFGAGQKDQRSSIYTNHGAGLAIDCTNCFIAGSFEVQGSISVKHWVLQDLIVTASPSSVLAALELEATITATKTPQSLSFDHTIFSQSIPGGGFEIPDLLKLGAFLDYSISAGCTFSGYASASFGVGASLPDSAQIKADYQNHGASSASGFDSTELTPVFHLDNASASVTLNATSKPAIKFGFELAGIGNLDVAVTVNLPEASVTLSTVSDENGVCGSGAGASKTGIKINGEASIEVELGIDASLGPHDVPWSTPLWSSSKPLPSTCFPKVFAIFEKPLIIKRRQTFAYYRIRLCNCQIFKDQKISNLSFDHSFYKLVSVFAQHRGPLYDCQDLRNQVINSAFDYSIIKRRYNHIISNQIFEYSIFKLIEVFAKLQNLYNRYKLQPSSFQINVKGVYAHLFFHFDPQNTAPDYQIIKVHFEHSNTFSHTGIRASRPQIDSLVIYTTSSSRRDRNDSTAT